MEETKTEPVHSLWTYTKKELAEREASWREREEAAYRRRQEGVEAAYRRIQERE